MSDYGFGAVLKRSARAKLGQIILGSCRQWYGNGAKYRGLIFGSKF
jgi:hypothetical protein